MSLVHRGKIGGSAKRIFFSPDAKLYAVGSRGQLCRVVDTETGATVKNLVHGGNVLSLPGDDPDENAAIEALKWSADNHYLFTGSVIDGIMRVWRRDDWSMIGYTQAQQANRQVEYIDVSSDNEVIVGGDEGVLYHYTFTPPKRLTPFATASNGSVGLRGPCRRGRERGGSGLGHPTLGGRCYGTPVSDLGWAVALDGI